MRMSMKHEELLKQAKTRFREAEEAEREIRAEAVTDLRFVAGDQWNEHLRREREAARRPALTINKLPTFVQQVVNDGRQNKPAIKISPVDNGADKDTAEIMQGLVRHIEYNSDADLAYQNAFEYSVSCGFGAFRILTDYCDEKSFDLEIRIEPIADPFCVYCDPLAKRADRADARYCFIVERMSLDEFKQRWPKSEAASSNFWGGEYDRAEGWITDNSVQVAEYWHIEPRKRKLLALEPDGELIFEDELDETHEGRAIAKEREVATMQVKCAKLNGAEVLEEDEWPGQYIPIVQVFGKELWVEGKRKLFSLIRFARDPQQLYNFYKTAQAEAVGLAPRAPFIGVEGQFEGHEDKWQSANVVNYAYLEYRPVSINGEPAPAPQRNIYEPPIQALSIGALQSADDIKATTGIHDASLGAQSNETSGIAIQQRQREGDAANFHFLDNLARAQRHVGRILLDLIPRIYDTNRWVRILGEDQSQKIVKVNEAYQDENGRDREYHLSAGKYDVTVSTGPSYATRRQEAFAMLTEFARAWPQLFQVAGDIVFRNSDIPGSDELADRIKKTLPPELAGGDDDDAPQQLPPQVQAQMQALTQQNQQLTEALNSASNDLNTRRLEIESRERIAALQTQAKLIEAQAKIGSTEALALLQAEIAAIGRRLELLNADEPIAEPGQTAQPQDGLPKAA
jgi:hypothetical protein